MNLTHNNYINYYEVIKMNRMLRNMTTGVIIGMTVTAMILPQLDRKTQRNLKRAGKRACIMAEDAYDMMMGYMR